MASCGIPVDFPWIFVRASPVIVANIISKEEPLQGIAALTF